MIRIGILAIVLSTTLFACNSEAQKKEATKKVSQNMPQTNIKVNKQYDKNGNLIKYDSTYSYYYSNIKNDTIKGDSIFNNFKGEFNQKYSFSNEPYFKDLFFQDTLLRYDFYKKDFFYNRFRENMERMDRLFHEMDSVKNNFYNQQFKAKKSINRK